MRPAQLGGSGRCSSSSSSRFGDAATDSVGAACAVVALGAVVVGAKIDCLATEGAAVVDEFLMFLDGHCEGVVVMCLWLRNGRGAGFGGSWKQ